MTVCWLNGELVPPAEAQVSVFDHGLLYGDGVFEGIRFYNGVAFRLDEHLRRLAHSAQALFLELPYSDGELTLAVEAAIAAFDREDGYIRLVATRGDGALGIDPRTCGRGNVFIIVADLELLPRRVRQEGARLIIASTRRLEPDGLDPRVKSLNYLNQIMARIEANQAGADEAILLSRGGRVAEGTAENVFVVKDGMLLTPPTADGALEGVTRNALLELAVDEGIPAREQSLTPYDLFTADECFLCGTGAELVLVREIAGRRLPVGERPIFSLLQRAFENRVMEETIGLYTIF